MKHRNTGNRGATGRGSQTTGTQSKVTSPSGIKMPQGYVPAANPQGPHGNVGALFTTKFPKSRYVAPNSFASHMKGYRSK
jgi:hypothetical protein